MCISSNIPGGGGLLSATLLAQLRNRILCHSHILSYSLGGFVHILQGSKDLCILYLWDTCRIEARNFGQNLTSSVVSGVCERDEHTPLMGKNIKEGGTFP